MNVNWKETYHRKNWVPNYTHFFKTKSHTFCQQFFCWHISILCFLQVLYHKINHRFNIKDFFCSTNYKMTEVKQHKILTNSTINFWYANIYSQPLTQCQSILVMVLLCILALIWIYSRMFVLKKIKIYKNEILS